MMYMISLSFYYRPNLFIKFFFKIIFNKILLKNLDLHKIGRGKQCHRITMINYIDSNQL